MNRVGSSVSMTVPVNFVLIDLPLRRFLSNKCKSMKDLLNTDKIRYLYIIISYMYVYIGDILAS